MLGCNLPGMEVPIFRGKQGFLGKGTFSEVYRVMDADTGELLVCKMLQNPAMAEREREILQAINHPLFPRYRGYWEDEDRQYLFMEYICGCNLKQYVRRRGRLSPKRAVTIARELAEGLLYLHEQSPRMIYRDIKPENIMVQQDGKIRLVDVGCACRVESMQEKVADMWSKSNSAVYTMAGTKGYAAPEQFIAGAGIGVESDVYALGRLLCFMIIGKDGIIELKSSFCGMRKGTIPRGLKLLIRQTIQEKRQDRIPDMRFFLRKLTVYERGSRWQRIREEIKAMYKKGGRAEFYFVENVRK